MGDSFDNVLDMGFKIFGILIAAAIVIFFVKNAAQFNTLAGAAGTLVKDVSTAGS